MIPSHIHSHSLPTPIIRRRRTFFAAIIGAFQAYFTVHDRSGEAIFQKLMALRQKYIGYKEMSSQLRGNVLAHYARTWRRFQGHDTQEVMSDLPEGLKMEIVYNEGVMRDWFRQTRVLNECRCVVAVLRCCVV